jgi:DNA-binding SARP family transcriptional activator
MWVTMDGNSVIEFGADMSRALLAYLVVQVRAPQRRETLAGLLWPEQPESAVIIPDLAQRRTDVP